MMNNANVVWCVEADGKKFLVNNRFVVEPNISTQRASLVDGMFVEVIMDNVRVTSRVDFGTGGFNIRVANPSDAELYTAVVEKQRVIELVNSGIDFFAMLERGVTTQVKEIVRRYPDAAEIVKGELISALSKAIDAWKK